MPLSFTIGNKRIFYHTCSESSKPLLSDKIVLLIERPTFWLKSRKTMNMYRTKHWQTVREQQKSASKVAKDYAHRLRIVLDDLRSLRLHF